MQKLLIIVLLVLSNSVSAKVTLTAEEREVIDSLIATYSAMVPMALLPADWPPDEGEICKWFTPSDKMVTNQSSAIQGREYFSNVITKVAQRLDSSAWFYPTIFNNGEYQISLPLQPNHHNDRTRVEYTDLDSGFTYVSWKQNANEPLALRQIAKAITLAKDDRCIILNLSRFDTMDLDSVLRALSLFSADDNSKITEVIRIANTSTDMTIEHRIAPESYAWHGPLLVVLDKNGWPGAIVRAALHDRPYTYIHFDRRATAFTGYQYEQVSLSHGYSCYVPVSTLLDCNGKLITTKISLDINWCGTPDPTEKSDKRDLYQRYEDLASGIVVNFREDNTTFTQRLYWAFEDTWDRWFADNAPTSLTIE